MTPRQQKEKNERRLRRTEMCNRSDNIQSCKDTPIFLYAAVCIDLFIFIHIFPRVRFPRVIYMIPIKSVFACLCTGLAPSLLTKVSFLRLKKFFFKKTQTQGPVSFSGGAQGNFSGGNFQVSGFELEKIDMNSSGRIFQVQNNSKC